MPYHLEMWSSLHKTNTWWMKINKSENWDDSTVDWETAFLSVMTVRISSGSQNFTVKCGSNKSNSLSPARYQNSLSHLNFHTRLIWARIRGTCPHTFSPSNDTAIVRFYNVIANLQKKRKEYTCHTLSPFCFKISKVSVRKKICLWFCLNDSNINQDSC